MNSIYSHTPIYKRKKRKQPIKFLIITFLFTLIISIFAIPFTKDHSRNVKPFFKELDTPIVIAHRGGSAFPENTLPAFEHSEQIGVDVLEFDIHMTKDGHLVAIHDFTVDRTTNGTGEVDSFTLDELQQLDAGYYFTDREGNYPFRNEGITIPTVEEIFEQFSHMDMNIEIKAQYPKAGPSEIEAKLWQLIQQYEMKDKVLLASFEQKIINKFNELANGQVAISGGKNEVTKFVLLNKFFLSKLYNPKVDALQMPTKVNLFNLADQKLVRNAQKLNMHVHYWTINDRETMEELLKLGADGIITDDPELLMEVMKELGMR
ncbi:hypothetical protein BKP35_09635 [Anaerobacillus arseniciselenatis]|uniref:GP-PDE domain-containing protein n=1 Tax=Anaerobacillus arseniciselenatis TaxID=85682 RepID=A0A1S2LKH7_9BACI|nr:glycerophosphodiester phosphodiesterase [Anaerobacillus arseniciselenatis]OIJ12824.1 hypothetical protein BKP35_09635 [Anaerobacillus arseniciselenatis]